MTPEDFKDAMQADKEATRAKWQGIVDEVFGPREVTATFDDIVRCECGSASKCERADCRSPWAGAVAYGDVSVLSGKVTTHIETIGAEIPAQDADAAFWAKVPEGYDWVAMDSDGVCRYYEKRPVSYNGTWMHEAYTLHRFVPALNDYHPRANWRNSLRCRPEGL